MCRVSCFRPGIASRPLICEGVGYREGYRDAVAVLTPDKRKMACCERVQVHFGQVGNNTMMR
jgi:hypothetical protein